MYRPVDLIRRFDEQPVLESDLPQIAARVFQADDGHGGIAGDFARGVEQMHVFALVYWHHMHAARLFLAFIHGCPQTFTTPDLPPSALLTRLDIQPRIGPIGQCAATVGATSRVVEMA